MLLHLAVAGRARVLVSGDRDLLALAGSTGLCPVLCIDVFFRQVLAG
jgi:predicted nucleic acid-binding protein